MKNPNPKKAFTLMEIMIVVIIMGIIASFAIPNYSKSIDQSHLQDAMMQLSSLRSANQIYYAKTSKYWPDTAGSQNIVAINNALSLNLIESGMTYACVCAGSCDGRQFTCTAVPTSTAFTVTVTEVPLSDTNPVCSGTCP